MLLDFSKSIKVINYILSENPIENLLQNNPVGYPESCYRREVLKQNKAH